MLTQKTPWGADNLDQLKRNVSRKSIYFPSYIDKDVRELIQKCLKLEESERFGY